MSKIQAIAIIGVFPVSKRLCKLVLNLLGTTQSSDCMHWERQKPEKEGGETR